MPEILTIECPFCKKETIKVLYKPSVLQFATTHSSAAGTKRKIYRTREKYKILSEKCSNCGKTRKELEKALRDKKPSREEILRRIKEAGLPFKIK